MNIQVKMHQYYSHAFPIKNLYTWINYGCNDPQKNGRREYSLATWAPNEPEGVISRFLSKPSLQDFRRMFLPPDVTASSLTDQDNYVLKLDIGPVYAVDVRYARDNKAKVLERELVFDIDMDDYEEVRTCCTGRTVCKHCFRFLVAAAKVLNFALKDHFGFKHLLFVFSGRRGIHCWVNDRIAREMSVEQRAGLLAYIQVQVHSIHSRTLSHPLISGAISRISGDFDELMKTQDYLSTKAKRLAFIQSIDSTKTTDLLSLDAMEEVFKGDFRKKAILKYVYPRLDIEVSKQTKHLLKSPFCVHPATLKVCVPLDFDTIDQFNPDTVPTLDTVLEELEELKKLMPNHPQTSQATMTNIDGKEVPVNRRGGNRVEEHLILQTSLGPYLQFFQDYLQALLADEKPDMKDDTSF